MIFILNESFITFRNYSRKIYAKPYIYSSSSFRSKFELRVVEGAKRRCLIKWMVCDHLIGVVIYEVFNDVTCERKGWPAPSIALYIKSPVAVHKCQ